ncbi:phosphatase PAP2 family protein [Quadrisphaera oryzae]|uniref:phosphatase PAP2 family protein n=1 Tax=Quadrisphaera TaxID=317661 RepID=UPI0016470ED3|nr:phosphatase PAP2 family protein [Quadrisphaera sp. RL12-1S]
MTTIPAPLRPTAGALPGPVSVQRAVGALVARWPVLAGAGLLVVVLDVLLGGPLSTVLDVRVNRWMAALPHTGPDLVLAHVLDHTGKITVVAPLLLVVAGLGSWRRRSWSSLVTAGGTLFVMLSVLAVVKFGLARGLAVNGDPSLLVPGGQSFPSGHAAQAAVTAGLLVALLPRLTGRPLRRSTALLVVAVPCSVMTSVSLYLGFHWTTDLVAGTLVGLLAARAGLAVERRCERRRAVRRLGAPPLRLVTAPFDVDLERSRVATSTGQTLIVARS